MADHLPADSPPMMKLPNELLDAIANYLDRPSLASLGLTNKQFNWSATNVLYKSYVNRDALSTAPFALFLRTMCKRPDLAKKVKSVSVRGWQSEHEVATGASWRGPAENAARKAKNKEEETVRKAQDITSKSRQLFRETFTLFMETAVKKGLIAECKLSLVSPLRQKRPIYATLQAECDFIRLIWHGVEDAHMVLLSCCPLCVSVAFANGVLVLFHDFFETSGQSGRALVERRVRICWQMLLALFSTTLLDVTASGSLYVFVIPQTAHSMFELFQLFAFVVGLVSAFLSSRDILKKLFASFS